MPLCGRNWADSIRWMVSLTSSPNSWRCSSVIVVRRYCTSTSRLRTKNHHRHICNSCHPGIANQLRIECQQSIGRFRVAARSGLPLDEGASAIQLPNGIDEGDELIRCRQLPRKFDLQIAPRLRNANPVILAEAVEQLNALFEHAIPRVAMRVLKFLILTELPFLKQGCRGILAQEVGGQSAFEGAAEEHGGPVIFLLPTIQITMTIASRAGEVLADLGVAINHQATSDPGGSSAAVGERSCQRLRGANPSRLRTEMPCTMAWLTFSTPWKPTSV